MHKPRRWSLSATSIGTEENSLGVPKVQSRALIYMRVGKHMQRGITTSTKGHESLMSKYRTGKEMAIEKQPE